MITKLFLAAIALAIPAFFLLLFVMSTYNRLAALRRRCAQVAAEVRAAGDGGKSADLAPELANAVAAYNAARASFSARLLGPLFGFPPDGATFAPARRG